MLTARKARFVVEYLIDHNGARAARAAGYSAATAKAQACNLLSEPAVAAAVADGERQAAEKAGITAEMIVAELRSIAFIQARSPLELEGITRDIAAGLGVKRAALVDLGRHLGMFKLSDETPGGVKIEIHFDSVDAAA